MTNADGLLSGTPNCLICGEPEVPGHHVNDKCPPDKQQGAPSEPVMVMVAKSWVEVWHGYFTAPNLIMGPERQLAERVERHRLRNQHICDRSCPDNRNLPPPSEILLPS